MHYYIYPNGGNAKYLAWAIDFLNSSGGGGDSYSFIDDKEREHSLEMMAITIKQEIQSGNARLLLSSPKYYDILLNNCIEVGIKSVVDGIAFLANKINSYYKSHYETSKIIAVFTSGFSNYQKHLGSILEILKSKGFLPVYIVSYEHLWLAEILEDFKKQNTLYVLADCEFLEHLNFFPFIIEQTNIIRFHTGVSSLKIVTSMEQISNPICSKKGMLDILNYAFFGATYLNVHSQTLFERLKKNQTFDGYLPDTSSLRFIKGGYPSIEKEVADFGNVDYSVPRDSVIFLSCFLNFEMPDKLASIMRKVLESNYRVIFKSCPPLKDRSEEEYAFAKMFFDYDNFVYWNHTPKLTPQELHRSICAIEIYSSMMYSYPAITKRPAILVYPNEESVKDIDDSFYNENLHIRVYEDKMQHLLPTIHSLSKDREYQEQWEMKIMDYLENDLYNYRCSSEYLANWIANWYEKRKILSSD